MDAEAAAVRLLLPLHRKRHIPESYSIVCIYVNGIKPIFNQVFDPMTLTDMLFLLLKNAKDSSYSLVNLFDAGTGHTYKEN